jgi:hypothetical protein
MEVTYVLWTNSLWCACQIYMRKCTIINSFSLRTYYICVRGQCRIARFTFRRYVGPNKRARHFTYSFQVCTSLADDVLYRRGCRVRNLDEKYDYSRECDYMVIPFNDFKTIFDFNELLYLIYGRTMYCDLIISMANSRFKCESVLKTVKKLAFPFICPSVSKQRKYVFLYSHIPAINIYDLSLCFSLLFQHWIAWEYKKIYH